MLLITNKAGQQRSLLFTVICIYDLYLNNNYNHFMQPSNGNTKWFYASFEN